MADVDLAVIGAGLSGCVLVSALRRNHTVDSMVILEAGRGPGGRCATRRRRDDALWRLDHGAPTLSFSGAPQGRLGALVGDLCDRGVLAPDAGPVVGLDGDGVLCEPPAHPLLCGPRWRGQPTMAAVAETLLADAGDAVFTCFGERISKLSWEDGRWLLPGGWRAHTLVLSGTLLAHPRSLAMLGWPDVPLRSAVAVGVDPGLDAALESIAEMTASVRWNLMLELPSVIGDLCSSDPFPRQIWLTPEARDHCGVERLVLHQQSGGRLGLVVHGLDDGAAIRPDTQPDLLVDHEQRLLAVLPQLLVPWPALQAALSGARSLGVMRWGAAQPLDQALPRSLQWCPQARVGFCGDWIAGAGFGMAEGALQSALDLAETLQ
jgi:predicted NAD/FAD-dependent oxidoreductase